ncbi:MAG: MarR family transcriptional regulator [Aestuariivirga sp.]
MSQTHFTPRLQDLLCFSLYAANNAMNRLYVPLLEPLNITYAQYVVLVVLWEADGLPVKQIGDKLGLETNTLTPLLKRMEASGLVKRRRNPADERQVIVSLTTAGQKLQARTAHIPACIAEATEMKLANVMDLRSTLSDLRQSLAKNSGRRTAGRAKA